MGSSASYVVREDFLEEGCPNCSSKNGKLIRRGIAKEFKARGWCEPRQSALK